MGYIPKDARWYLADLVLEHKIAGDHRNVVHVNIHLIEAASPKQAYEKAVALGGQSEYTYANTDDREVRVIFRGLRNLDVIHDALEDGAEIAFEERVAVPEQELSGLVRAREQLSVFREVARDREKPNYMPKSVMDALNAELSRPTPPEP